MNMLKVSKGICTPLSRLLLMRTHVRSRSYGTVIQGSKYTPEYTQYLTLSNGEVGSYFHDIPYELDFNSRTVNMVVEIPRWSNGKFEISRNKEFNPITQDVKNGKVRFVNNIFPFHGYITNYGAIPQTWEDPTVESREEGLKGLKGDNDPLDCCEIGSKVLAMGDIKKVKVLGSLALIDEDELDWKIIVIDLEDPMCDKVNSIHDVEEHFPGLLEATRKWFRDYKIPTGKSANKFAFGGNFKDAEETMSIIKGCHSSWKKLFEQQYGSHISLPAIKRAGSGVIHKSSVVEDGKLPSEVAKWYYV